MENEKAIQIYNPETVELIKTTVMPKDATPQELELYLYQAKRTGLDALSRQIYCIKTGGKLSIQATIDGFRLIAERSGKYAGQMPPMWCGLDGVWVDVWLQKAPPVAAKVGVYRTDFKEPLIAVAKYDTYAQVFNGKPNFTWSKMPDLMLSKCAEALALRKAFPQELSGLYTNDEMNNFTEPEPQKPVKAETEDPDSPYTKMKYAKTLDEVKKLWSENKSLQKEKTFTELKDKRKKELSEIKPEDLTDPMPYKKEEESYLGEMKKLETEEKKKLKTVEDYKVILADCVILQQLQQTFKEFVFEGLTLVEKEKIKIFYKERIKELS